MFLKGSAPCAIPCRPHLNSEIKLRSRRFEREQLPMTNSARQITNAMTSMTVRAPHCCRVSLLIILRTQLIDAATDDADLSSLASSAVLLAEDKPLGRISHNFGASKSRSEVQNFLRRNPHYLPHSQAQNERPSSASTAFDSEFINRFGAKNRSADAYKNDFRGTLPPGL